VDDPLEDSKVTGVRLVYQSLSLFDNNVIQVLV
jgi:hypothetical protein